LSYRSEFSSSRGWNCVDTNIRLVGTKGKSFRNYLKKNGVHTIIRYYASSRRAKTLTNAEAKIISQDGFNILPVYQDNARKTSDFGKSKGRSSGANALEFVDYIGQPEGSTIFFAVDTDFSTGNINKYVVPYFEGVKEKLGSGFRIGAYGSGKALERLMEEDLIEVPWISMSRAFTGTKDFFYSNKWAMRQVPPPKKYGSVHYDKNVMKWDIDKIGAFRYDDNGEAFIVGQKSRLIPSIDDKVGGYGEGILKKWLTFMTNL
jgi:hypothetical protein